MTKHDLKIVARTLRAERIEIEKKYHQVGGTRGEHTSAMALEYWWSSGAVMLLAKRLSQALLPPPATEEDRLAFLRACLSWKWDDPDWTKDPRWRTHARAVRA